MTAKEYLNQAYWLDQRINSKLQQLGMLNDLATRCTAVLTGMPGSTNHGGSKVSSAVERIIDLQSEIEREANTLIALKQEVKDTIGAVDDEECRVILEKRYLCYLPWKDIAEDLSLSTQHLFRLHKVALKKICVPTKDESK